MFSISPITIAISMIAAIAASYYMNLHISGMAAILILLVFAAGLLLKRGFFMVAFAAAAAFVLAALSYSFHTSTAMHPLQLQLKRYAALSGVVMSNPRDTGNSVSCIVKVDSINGSKLHYCEYIMLSTEQDLSCGDCIDFKGIIKPLPMQMNENGFDYTIYYHSQNIYTRMYTKNISVTGKTWVSSPYFISQKFYAAADKVIFRYLDGDRAAIASAVLTGNKQHFSKKYKQVLQSTGMLRLIHPAFAHLILLSALFYLINTVLSKKYTDIAAMAILLGYALISSSSVGFTKTIIAVFIMMLQRKLYGAAFYPNAIAWIFIYCAIFMPMQILNSTLILSAAIGLMVWAFSGYLSKKLEFLPRLLRRFIVIQIICSFAAVPLYAIWYRGLCIYTIFAAIIIIPMVLLMLITAIPMLALFELFSAAPIISGYFGFAISVIYKLPFIIKQLPFSELYIPKLSPAMILLYVCLCLAFYFHIKNRHTKRAVLTAVAAGLSISLIGSAITRIGTSEFIFVNVGQADASLIHTAYGATVIIDGGGGTQYSDYNPGEEIFLPYLQTKGIGIIDAAFVSHFHRDHMQGVISAIENLSVRRVYFLPPDSENTTETEWYNRLCAAAEENNTELYPITVPIRIAFDCGLSFDVYTPPKSLLYTKDENDRSLLIKASYGENSVLYTGDMSTAAEQAFEKMGIDLCADVLKVAHHGSKYSSSPQWCDAVSPRYSLISCGIDNTYGHPAESTLQNLSSSTIIRTDLNGDVKFEMNKKCIKQISSYR